MIQNETTFVLDYRVPQLFLLEIMVHWIAFAIIDRRRLFQLKIRDPRPVIIQGA